MRGNNGPNPDARTAHYGRISRARAPSSFFRLVGFNHSDLWDAEDPLAFAIRKIELDYKKPARVDDHLT